MAVKHSLVHHNSTFETVSLDQFAGNSTQFRTKSNDFVSKVYVDSELNLMDLNNDGYVDYGEIYTYMEANKQKQQQLKSNQPAHS